VRRAEALRASGWSSLTALVLVWVAVVGYFAYEMPGNFATMATAERVMRQGSVVALASIGMTFVIASGGIDLSVGSVVALVTVVAAWAIDSLGWSPAAALSLGVASSVAARLRLSSFVVTLGALLIYRGVALGLADNEVIHVPMSWVNRLLATLPEGQKWQIFPIGVWMVLICAWMGAFVMRKTVFGRQVLAVGANEEACRLSGIRVERVRVGAFVVMGLCAGLAGCLQFSRLSAGDPGVAQGLELDVIAAVVIGGASLSGGTGSIAGSIVGALLMATIHAGLSQMGLLNWVQQIVTGAIIVGAVALDRWRSARAA
jgi:ribose/xylose/arabinose/galactoside ABC-type transport system permease subunit